MPGRQVRKRNMVKNMRHHHQTARTICRSARHILAVTGAGISVPSGLPEAEETLRGVPIDKIFTKEQAGRHMIAYQKIFEEIANAWGGATPNAAHIALAQKAIFIITTNLDGLHQQAGSSEVLELHGSVVRRRCLVCHTVIRLSASEYGNVECPLCQGPLWPDVVLEGEPVRQLAKALHWLALADVLLVIGSSLKMLPIRDFPRYAKENGVPVFVVNDHADKWVPYYLLD